jgi:hypothetical protein
VLLIILIAALASSGHGSSVSESYRYGHDELGPVAVQEMDGAGIEDPDRACQMARTEGTDVIGADVGGRFVHIPRPPDSYNASQGKKGCLAYVSEHTDSGAKWWENPR